MNARNTGGGRSGRKLNIYIVQNEKWEIGEIERETESGFSVKVGSIQNWDNNPKRAKVNWTN